MLPCGDVNNENMHLGGEEQMGEPGKMKKQDEIKMTSSWFHRLVFIVSSTRTPRSHRGWCQLRNHLEQVRRPQVQFNTVYWLFFVFFPARLLQVIGSSCLVLVCQRSEHQD